MTTEQDSSPISANPTETASETEIQKLEAENAELHQQIAELKQREQANSELLATVSHEIRTPIGAVMSMVELLQLTGLNENQQQYAKTLQLAANNLAILTDDILNFARLESGQVKLEQGEIELAKFLQTATASIQPRAEAKGLAFTLEIESSCPEFIIGDQSRLSQIINNLANNALKFTVKGRISLKLSAIKIENAVDEYLIRVEMQDTGIGMSKSEQQNIFTPFAQANNTIQTKFGGSGLGLCISRKLAERMGGTMAYNSRSDVGSCFWFTFRAKKATTQSEMTNNASSKMEQETTLQGHVMVVEDNQLNQMLIKTYLEKFGLSFDIANNGEEALELMGKQIEPTEPSEETKPYDLILMDIMMPKMDGITATRELIRLSEGKALPPILALTANVLEDQIQLYAEAGMKGHISKPFRGEELFQELEKHLVHNQNKTDQHQVLSA